MIVEIRGASTRNKGAELMLRAIADQLRGQHRAAVEPRIGSYDERASMGLLQKFSNRLPEPVIRAGARALPKKARSHLLDQYGIVFDDGIEAVFDASGFAYSDQFDLKRCAIAADRAERSRRQGKPFVLLPQAFGPFTSAALREAFVRLVENSDLAYARDRVSYEHVLSTGCRTDHVRLAPDFTCLLEAELPGEFKPSERLALIVPSEKLLGQASSTVREAYLPFLAAAVEWFRREAYDVRMLLHARDDSGTIDQLQDHLEHHAPVIHFLDARQLKGIIGTAKIVVGSRFHALVSALSQGVPAVGVGWSHKYAMLFDDYGCDEHIVDPTIGAEALAEHLATLIHGSPRDRVVRGLLAAAASERQRARLMWSEVHALLSAADR